MIIRKTKNTTHTASSLLHSLQNNYISVIPQSYRNTLSTTERIIKTSNLQYSPTSHIEPFPIHPISIATVPSLKLQTSPFPPTQFFFPIHNGWTLMTLIKQFGKQFLISIIQKSTHPMNS